MFGLNLYLSFVRIYLCISATYTTHTHVYTYSLVKKRLFYLNLVTSCLSSDAYCAHLLVKPFRVDWSSVELQRCYRVCRLARFSARKTDAVWYKDQRMSRAHSFPTSEPFQCILFSREDARHNLVHCLFLQINEAWRMGKCLPHLDQIYRWRRGEYIKSTFLKHYGGTGRMAGSEHCRMKYVGTDRTVPHRTVPHPTAPHRVGSK